MIVLVTDDEPNIRQLLKKILEKDYTVIEATNGQEAVEIATREKPDIVLLDIMMPKLDGYSACFALKNQTATKSALVVMLSGYGQDLNKKLAKEMGADGYLSKPFTKEGLLATINGLLKQEK